MIEQFYPWYWKYYDMAEGEEGGEAGGGDDSGDDSGEEGGDTDTTMGKVTGTQEGYEEPIIDPDEEDVFIAPEKQLVVPLNTIVGSKNISSLTILSNDQSPLIGVKRQEGSNTEMTISGSGVVASAKIIGTPGAKFYLDIKDIDNEDVFNLSNVEVPQSGVYSFDIAFPRYNKTNKYKINLKPGDGSKIARSFPKTDPMWVIHQLSDPVITFTKETGTIAGATYSGADKTITTKAGAKMSVATSSAHRTNRDKPTSLTSSTASPSMLLFGEFDYAVTAAKSGAKIYVNTTGISKTPKYINSTIKKKLVKADVINANTIHLDNVDDLYIGMQCTLDSYTKTNLSDGGTTLKLSNTKDLIPGMRLVGEGIYGLAKIISIDNDSEITISKSVKTERKKEIDFVHLFGSVKITSIDVNTNIITLNGRVSKITEGTLLSFKNNEAVFTSERTFSGSGSASASLTNEIRFNGAFPSRDVTFTLRTNEIFTLTPNAWDQQVLTSKGTAIDINVLAPDTDDNSGSKTPSTVRNPIHGIISGAYGSGDGTITYTPNPGFVGKDNFTFKVSDGTTNSETKTVYITVTK